VKPTLLKGPTDLVVIENDDAVFTAAVFGKPEPNVQWQVKCYKQIPLWNAIMTTFIYNIFGFFKFLINSSNHVLVGQV